MEEHPFLRLYCPNVRNNNNHSNVLQEDFINTSNIEIKKNRGSMSQQHIEQNIEIKLPNDCQLEKVQSPISKDLRELTTKNNNNGQQIYFKVLDAKSLDGICYDSLPDVTLARLKLIEVDKFGDIVMILDFDNNSSYSSFGKKETLH